MAHMIGLMRLGRDAELRYLPSGEAVANLSLAFNYGKKENGKRASQWIDASLWGKRAEAMTPYLKKGTALDVILSEPHIEEYEGKEGKRSKLVARVLDIEFAGSREEASQNAQGEAGQSRSAPAAERAERQPASNVRGFEDMDDEIPF